MKSLNRVTLIGNLTRDPEVKQTTTGSSFCTFSVATNRDWTDSTGKERSEVMFHRIIAWSKLAEILPLFAHKGSRVYVDGRIVYREYKDKEGNNRFITEIVANDVIGLDSKKKDSASENELGLENFSQEKTTLTEEDVSIPEPV